MLPQCFGLYPSDIYVLKVIHRNTGTRCKIWSKLTIKTPEQRHWRRSGVLTVNFDHISQLAIVISHHLIASWLRTRRKLKKDGRAKSEIGYESERPANTNNKGCLCDNWKPSFLPLFIFWLAYIFEASYSTFVTSVSKKSSSIGQLELDK